MNLKEIEKYVREYIINNLFFEKNGKKYIKEDDIKNLKLDYNEQLLLNKILKRLNIKIDDTINMKNRTGLVRDFDYGELVTFGLKEKDKPRLANIEYENGNIVYEDYEKLIVYIEKEFIPNHIMSRTKKNRDGDIEQIFSVELNQILSLKLNYDEVDFIFKYLAEQDIKVIGRTPLVENKYGNYIFINNYDYKNLPTYINDPVEERKLFLEYQKTKSIDIRNKIISNNMRLAKYFANRFSKSNKFERRILESYAYEGLIISVENFDVNKEQRFSTFASKIIQNELKKGMMKEMGLTPSDGNYYWKYYIPALPYIEIVEDKYNVKINDNEDLIDEVIDLMIKENVKFSEKDRNYIKLIIKRINFKNMINFDSLNDISVKENTEVDALTPLIKENINTILNELTSVEKTVIVLRFGFNGEEPKTYEEIGKRLNLTRERVRQILDKTLRKLRHPLRLSRLKYFNEHFDEKASLENDKVYNFENEYIKKI